MLQEVVSLKEGEWSCYRGGHFNGGRMVMLQRWSLMEGEWVILPRWSLMEGEWLCNSR